MGLYLGGCPWCGSEESLVGKDYLDELNPYGEAIKTVVLSMVLALLLGSYVRATGE